MLIDKREIERVKRANELVGFIRSRGVSLTQRGKQFVGLCPMHPDTEPSLIVDPRKQLWNCLGACHEGGDVYGFVMKADGVDFREAHRRLGGHEAESKYVMVDDQQWLERAVDHFDGAPFSRALIEAGERPHETAVVVFAGVSVAGGLLGSVVIPASSVTTLGLGTTTTTAAAAPAVVGPVFSRATLRAFQRQLAQHGRAALEKSLASFEKRLAEHLLKIEAARRAGGYTSSMERKSKSFVNL